MAMSFAFIQARAIANSSLLRSALIVSPSYLYTSKVPVTMVVEGGELKLNRPEEKALEIATQICVSKVANTNLGVSAEGDQRLGEFFEAIYNKVVEITKSIP